MKFWNSVQKRCLVAVALLAATSPALARPPKPALPAEPPPYITAPITGSYQPRARTDTIIRQATILDGAGNRLIGDVLMRDGRIVALGPDLANDSGATEIAGRGKWVTPGLIDIHTHYGTYLLPQTAAEAEVSDVIEDSDFNVADTWIEHAIRPGDPAFSRALAGGVTTVQVLPGSGALFGGRSVILKPLPTVTMDQMRFPGARQGLKMACGGNPAGSFGGRGRFPNSRQGEIAGIRRALLDTRHYMEEWEDHGGGRKGGRGPRRDLKMDTLAAAMRGDLPVHLHCYRADDIATWVSVLDEFGIRIAAVHHATEAYKVAPMLADRGICAAVWPDWWGFKREAEDGIPENAAFVDAAGGCAIMHSDIPVLGNLLNIEASKAAAAGRRAGLTIPPERAIRWITSNPAKAIGLGDRIGTIAPGMNADLVIWSADPFSVYSHVEQVFMDGAILYDRNAKDGAGASDFELGRPQRGGIR